MNGQSFLGIILGHLIPQNNGIQSSLKGIYAAEWLISGTGDGGWMGIIMRIILENVTGEPERRSRWRRKEVNRKGVSYIFWK